VRGKGSEDNLKRFVEEMSIRVITASPASFSRKFGQTSPERPDSTRSYIGYVSILRVFGVPIEVIIMH
jgi:hypothetical protein